jgi:hypothetical protein
MTRIAAMLAFLALAIMPAQAEECVPADTVLAEVAALPGWAMIAEQPINGATIDRIVLYTADGAIWALGLYGDCYAQGPVAIDYVAPSVSMPVPIQKAPPAGEDMRRDRSEIKGGMR